MHAVRHLTLLLALLLAAAGIAPAQEPPAPDAADAVQVKAAAGINVPMQPVPPEMRAREGVAFDASQSRGVFIGINEFSDESVSDLRFAVDDAVDLAHQFYELQLIAPKGIILMLAGEPTKEESRARLEALRQAGAPAPIRPTLTAIRRAMTDAAKASGPDGLFVASISTHGYYTGIDAIIAEDTIVDTNLASGQLAETSLTTARFTGFINSANAGRKLGLIDACRENLIKPAKGGIGGMSPLSDAAMNVLAGLEGVAVLTATKTGGFGFDGGRDLDDSEIRNGVFTHYVLQVLRNGTGDPNEETITLGRVAEAVDTRMKAWTARRWREAVGIGQNETFGDWAALPLAMNPAATETMKDWREKLKTAAETLGVIGARYRSGGFTTELQSEIEDALGRLAALPPSTGEALVTRIEEVSDGRLRIVDFKGWWIVVGRIEYAAPTPTPTPVPAAQPTPTPVGAVATLPPPPPIPTRASGSTDDGVPDVTTVKSKGETPGITFLDGIPETINFLQARDGFTIRWKPIGGKNLEYHFRLNEDLYGAEQRDYAVTRNASTTLRIESGKNGLKPGEPNFFRVRAVLRSPAQGVRPDSDWITIKIEVEDNLPPTIEFALAPEQGTEFVGLDVPVRLRGDDKDGKVEKYQLVLNDANDPSCPECLMENETGEFIVPARLLSESTHVLKAQAIDDSGKRSEIIERHFFWRMATPTPSPTPRPTASPSPSRTPRPTESPVPTRTPRPTASPTPAGPVVETKIGGRDALVVTLPRGTTMNFIRIPGGTFDMGSDNGAVDEKPVVKNVRITPFWMAETEVTVGQFKEFIAANPRYKTTAEQSGDTSTWKSPKYGDDAIPQDDTHPVVEVSHFDAVAFSQWLSTYTGREFRLPYESQWEYACRAGSTTDWFWGTDPNGASQYANTGDQNDGHRYTAPVKSHRPNGFGLYDTSGNVWEWCLDWYDFSAYNSLPGPNPVNLKEGSFRVYRGGSWYNDPLYARSADRYWNSPGNRLDSVGFRLCSPN